jgi:hypothetical protein
MNTHRFAFAGFVAVIALNGCSTTGTQSTTSSSATAPANAIVIDKFDLPKLPPGKTLADFNRDNTATTRKEGDNTITEYRLRGKLYKVTVTPASGSAYTLVDEKGDGKFVRMGEISPRITVPMWVLLSW